MKKINFKNIVPSFFGTLKLAILTVLVLVCFAACTSPNETPKYESFFKGSFDFGTTKLPDGMVLGCSGDGATNPAIKDGVMTIDVKSIYEGSSSYLTINADCKEEMELSYKVYMDIYIGNAKYARAGVFRVYIDNTKVAEHCNCDCKFKEEIITVPSGKHTIKFVFEQEQDYCAPDPSENVVKLDDIALSKIITYSEISENFEGGSLKAKYKWIGDATLTSASELNADFGDVNGKFARLPVDSWTTTKMKLNSVATLEKSTLSFKYYPIVPTKNEANIKFSVLVDGEVVWADNTPGKNNDKWISITTLIDVGKHTLEFIAENPSGWYLEGDKSSNAIYIDDISLVPDVATSIIITPRAKQQTYIGCKDYEKIVAKAYAVRKDGTIKTDINVTLSATGGTIDSNGVFTPTSVGKAKITASYGDITVTSGDIAVYDSDYMKKPFTYNGKNYNGIDETTASGSVNPEKTDISEITITSPTATTFDADGFFTLEGTVKNEKTYNYAIVEIYKGEKSNNNPYKTYYLLRDDFSERIWLRFGKGAYTVTVCNLQEIELSKELGAEGAFGGCSYSAAQVFNVTNTCEESAGGEDDGKWIYPSNFIQSDNFLITNTTDEALSGLPTNATDRQKIKAIHDYIVSTKYYDDDSLEDGKRKKQDAVSVMRYGTCVCEGYANLTAAMARYAGIPAKYVGGNNKNPLEVGHGWNNIYIDGKWYFIDTTWDDQDRDPSSKYVSYDYFLLTTMNGKDGDHDDFLFEDDITRSAVLVPTIPEWEEDYSNGWY